MSMMKNFKKLFLAFSLVVLTAIGGFLIYAAERQQQTAVDAINNFLSK